MAAGATSAWNKTNWAAKGTIDTMPHDKICVLYRQTSPTNMQHTGIYTGDEYFIDARGSATGVVRNKWGTYNWTHWGIPKGLYTDLNIKEELIIVLYTATVTAPSGNTVRMRANSSTSAKELTTIKVGTVVEVIEETNADWLKITYGGMTGYMMKKYLAKTTAQGGDTNGAYIKIPCGTAEKAKEFLEILKKQQLALKVRKWEFSKRLTVADTIIYCALVIGCLVILLVRSDIATYIAGIITTLTTCLITLRGFYYGKSALENYRKIKNDIDKVIDNDNDDENEDEESEEEEVG